MGDNKYENHPSWGMIRFGRVSGYSGPLFGCSIKPDSWITLKISRGEKTHKYGSDWYSGGDEIIEVSLSPAQFTELLTNFNHGSGVPCTITSNGGKQVERFAEDIDDQESRKVVDEMRKMGKDISKALDAFLAEVDKMIADKAITKKAGESLKQHFARTNQDMKSNIPFYLNQLDEAASKIVTEKKAELDASVTHMVTKLGLEKLEDMKKIMYHSEDKKAIDNKKE